MLKLSSTKYVEARARRIQVVPRVNVVDVSGLEPPILESDPVQSIEEQQPQQPQEDVNVHPIFWKEPGQRTPSEIRWVWDPLTGNMNIGTQSRHSGMTPSGTEWDAVLRGFYFPNQKLVSIRPYYWPNGDYDQWDEGHAELSADIQMAFIMAIQPTLKQQEPEIQFKTNIDNRWLEQTTGRYSW